MTLKFDDPIRQLSGIKHFKALYLLFCKPRLALFQLTVFVPSVSTIKSLLVGSCFFFRLRCCCTFERTWFVLIFFIAYFPYEGCGESRQVRKFYYGISVLFLARSEERCPCV